MSFCNFNDLRNKSINPIILQINREGGERMSFLQGPINQFPGVQSLFSLAAKPLNKVGKVGRISFAVSVNWKSGFGNRQTVPMRWCICWQSIWHDTRKTDLSFFHFYSFCLIFWIFYAFFIVFGFDQKFWLVIGN